MRDLPKGNIIRNNKQINIPYFFSSLRIELLPVWGVYCLESPNSYCSKESLPRATQWSILFVTLCVLYTYKCVWAHMCACMQVLMCVLYWLYIKPSDILYMCLAIIVGKSLYTHTYIHINNSRIRRGKVDVTIWFTSVSWPTFLPPVHQEHWTDTFTTSRLQCVREWPDLNLCPCDHSISELPAFLRSLLPQIHVLY